MLCRKITNLASALCLVAEPVELSAAVDIVEQGPEKEDTPPPAEPG